MKKVLSILLLGLSMLTTPICAQNYSALWKQVKTAQDKDLPKTEYELLTQIADKAETEKAYGQLMKAKIQSIRAINSINSDSLLPAVRRVESEYAKTSDKALKAVYAAVLYKIYNMEGNRLHADNEKGHEAKTENIARLPSPTWTCLARQRRGHSNRWWWRALTPIYSGATC